MEAIEKKFPVTEVAESVHTEQSNDPKRLGGQPTLSRKIINHFRRFWICHLIINICVSLTVSLLLAYVAYPALVQDGVNRSYLVVLNQSVQDPRPDSFILQASALLRTPSPFIPVFDSFDASFYLEGSDVPFIVNMSTPEFMGANENVISITKRIPLGSANSDSFADFSEHLLSATSNITIYLRGQGRCRLGALPIVTVKYNQAIPVIGFNDLEGAKITNLEFVNQTSTDASDGANVLGKASITNPSTMTLTLGNVSQTIYGPSTANGTTGVFLGNSTLPNLVLRPGTAEYDFRFAADSVAFVNLLKDPRYACGVFPATLVQERSIYDGSVVPYFTSAMRQQNLSMTIDIRATFQQAGLGSLLASDCSI